MYCHLNICVVVAKSFIQVGGSYNSIPVSCCSNIGTMYCTFVCLINIMLPAIFVYKLFFQNKVFQVCPYLVLLLLFIRGLRVGAASSNFTRIVCWYRLELHSGFFLPVGLVHHIDYVPLQTRYINNIITNIYIQSFSWYIVLVARAEVFKYS